MNTERKDWWLNDGLNDWRKNAEQSFASFIPPLDWPLKIRGKEIGSCTGLVDITIDSGPAMSVWAFEKGGFAKTWKIDDQAPPFWQSVTRDGMVREFDNDDFEQVSESSSSRQMIPGVTYDADGDVVMEDDQSPLF